MQGLTLFRSRFFWKLYASYAALVLVTTLIIGVLVHHQMKSSLVAEVESSLKHKVVLLAPFAARSFRSAETPALQEQAVQLGQETETRITLIRPDGTVIVDSEENPQGMDNHRNRPEVQAALSQSFGVSRRYSQTVRYSMLYVARAIADEDGLLGIVRVAIPLQAVEERLASMRATIALGAAVGCVAAWGLGLLVSRRITAPIAQMTAVAEAMRNRQYDRRVWAISNDEIGLLGAALNQLGAEVTKQIADLSQERAQIQAIVASMVEGVIAVDDADRVLLCNRAACELLRIEESCVPGRRLWEIVRLGDLSRLIAQARSRGPVQGEVVLHQGDRQRVLDVHVARFEGGGTRGLVLVLHDISALRRLEQVRRDFVANVSHEIRTPLTSIKGYVETLLGGALHDQENNVRFLQKIDEHVGRLTKLVHDLLSLARIESHEEQISPAAVDWRPIVEEVVRRHEMEIAQKSLTCSVELPQEGVRVLGDPEAMTQVLDNLLDNAVKYTPAGGQISLRVATDGAHGELHVEDSGIGIPKKDLDRIFERFYRVDKARSRELGGTGLGLSIVKHLVHAMNGEIHVHSQLGKGSRFAVRLPLVPLA